MGFGFGSGSKSTTNNTTNIDDTFAPVDNRIIEGGSIVGSTTSFRGDGNTVISTDHGAIQSALTATERSVDAALNTVSASAAQMFTLADNTRKDSLDAASNTFAQSLATIERDASASRQQVANQISKAYDLAATHSRSEGAESMDKAVKVMAWGGAGLGILFIISQTVKAKK